jgi:hypothetical protein
MDDPRDTAGASEAARLEGLDAGRECLEAALEYLRLGLSPLCCCPPDHVGVGQWHKCDSPGKAPLHKWKALQDKAASEREVRDWFRRHPNGNVGCCLGPVSRLVGIDVDDEEGERQLAELSAGDVPSTWEFTSGKGRRLLYKIPDGAVLRTTHQDRGKKRPLSFLAAGSQTVMPPSRHPRGVRYVWVEGFSPDDISPAPAPPWLLDELRPGGPTGAGRAEPRKGRADAVLGDITDGRRDKTLTSMAGTMRHRGFEEEAIYAALTITNRARCKPPLPDETVRKIAHSVASRYPAGDVPLLLIHGGVHPGERRRVEVALPKENRPFVPFPIRSLPHPLVCVVEEGAAALGCDPTYIALPVMAAVAAAIGNSRSIQLKSSWYEPSIIWTGVIGDSGTLKTPAFKYALAPVYAVQRQFREEFARSLARYETDHADTPKADKPPRPVQRRAYCSDVTIEKLAQLLEDNPKGLLVARDELSGWLGSFMKYKAKGAGSDVPNWLELFSAGNLNVDRKTGERTHVSVEHAAASVTGGIQPKVLGRILSGDYFECGLAARMLLAWPPRRRKTWTEAEVSERTTEAYERLVHDLHGLTMRQVSESRFVTHRRKLSPAAKQVWVEFFTDFAREQEHAEGDMAAALSKLEAYAARFALIHHVVTHVALDTTDDRDIGSASVEAGITLARWFAQETRRVYAALKESDVERQTRRLLDWIRFRGDDGVTARDLYRSNSDRYSNPEEARAALDALAEAGAGRWVDQPTTERGGKPTRHFHLNPTPDDTAKTPRAGDEEEV